MQAVGAEASGAGSSLTAVAIGFLIMEEKWVHRFPLTVSKSRALTQKFICLKEGRILLVRVQRGRIFCSLCVSLMAIHKPSAHGYPRATWAERWGLPFGGSSMAQHLVPSFLTGVLKCHLISILSAMMEKANRRRGFVLGLLNFHGNLARLVKRHFLANFSSFAPLLGCRAWAASVTAGSCSFAAHSLVMEKS